MPYVTSASYLSRGPSRRRALGGALLAALLLAACAPAGRSTAPAPAASTSSGAQPAAAPAAGEPRPIRFGLPSLALSYMPMYIADEVGLFAERGLRAEFTLMETGIAPAAMDRGEVDIAGSGTSAVDYAAAGGDVRVFMRLFDASPWKMISRADIRTGADLRGQTIASSASTPKLFALEGVRRLGLVANENVFFIETGGTSASFTALMTNQIGAAVVTPPFDAKLKSQGYNELLFLGDLLDLPYVELPTSRTNLEKRPDLIKDTIRALFASLQWWRDNPEPTIAMIAQKFEVTPDEARDAYGTFTRIMTTTGDIHESSIRSYLRMRAEVSGTPADAPFDSLVDMRLLREVQTELGIK